MKKLFLAFLTMSLTTGLFAQTEKGKFFVSGGTGLQFASSNIELEYDGESLGDIDSSSFSIMGSAGYFVIDNLAVGLSTTISTTTTKDLGDEFTSKYTMLLPSLSYYFPVEGNFRPFVAAGAGYAWNTQEEEIGGNIETSKLRGLSASLSGGASYFINDFISLDFGLAYAIANLKDSDDPDFVQKGNSIGGVIGFSLYF